jgi:ABC-type nitrate/sulfonate/bicarbonate transport system substrate-binding protein
VDLKRVRQRRFRICVRATKHRWEESMLLSDQARNLAFAIGIAAAALGSAAQVEAQDRVRIGLQIGTAGPLRVVLPQIEGKYNLKFEIKDFRDSTSAMLALEQQELDIANTTAQHLVRAMEENIPVVWVAGWGAGYNVLIAAKSLAVSKDDWRALDQLIKKRKAENNPIKIGVPTGSMQHLKLLMALQEAGISEKDLTVVNIPFPTHPRAIDAGEVDLAMTLATFGALSIHGGKGALFAHLYGDKAGRQEIGFIVHRDTVSKREDYLRRLLAAYVEAMRSFITDVPKQITLELGYLKLPEPVVTMTLKDFLRLNYRTNVSDIQLMARQMHQLGWAKKDHSADVERVLDFAILQKASGETAESLRKW